MTESDIFTNLNPKDRWIEKEHSKTDDKYGTYPDKRDIDTHIKNGLIILDKPKGPTSHQAAAWVRDIFQLKKAGHSGTLDPQVTGVLPVLLENATKIIPALVRGRKEYVCIMQLHKAVSKEKIIRSAERFQGKIEQMPPIKSAVKRRLRTREIYSLEILEIEDQYVLFKSEVEAGTYIRTLCTDWGRELGVKAHMQELRRTKAGSLPEIESHTLQEIKDAHEFYLETGDEKYLREIINPLERGVAHLPKIIVKDSSISAICHGAPLHTGGIVRFTENIKENHPLAIMSLKGELISLADAKMGSKTIEESNKGIAAKTTRVIMPENTYPRTW